MAPDDLNLTVDFNDATFESADASDPSAPEVWNSNRNSSGDNAASMAVLGAGSKAAEFFFEFDDISIDSDSDSDFSILSDMEGGSRVLRVDTSADQGSFKFSNIVSDSYQNGNNGPSVIYDNVQYGGAEGVAALGVTDAFLKLINNPATNPSTGGSLDNDSIVHAGAVSGATALLSLGETADGKIDLSFNSSAAPQTFQVYKAIFQDQATQTFVL